MNTAKSTERLYSVLKFISPFLRDILEKDPVSLHSIFKALAYGQSGITFALVLTNLENPNIVIAGFAALFPIFFVFGIFFGFMEAGKNKNENFFSSIALSFLACSSLNLIFLAILFFLSSIYLGIAYILGIFANFHIFGYAMGFYVKLRDS
jgi:hypothetical protein|tara:strand:- start:685 stop:1137 length:453 start_codon:yes stop_codon:yes gene_type:complete